MQQGMAAPQAPQGGADQLNTLVQSLNQGLSSLSELMMASQDPRAQPLSQITQAFQQTMLGQEGMAPEASQGMAPAVSGVAPTQPAGPA